MDKETFIEAWTRKGATVIPFANGAYAYDERTGARCSLIEGKACSAYKNGVWAPIETKEDIDDF